MSIIIITNSLSIYRKKYLFSINFKYKYFYNVFITNIKGIKSYGKMSKMWI